MHDLQLFDTTFIGISGGPVPLHPPPFSSVQSYKFNKLTIFSAYHANSLAHLRRALYIECTLVADSQLILELLFLQRRGGCSLTVLLFFLMLVGTCCFVLSASLCVVRPKKSFQRKKKLSVCEKCCRFFVLY